MSQMGALDLYLPNGERKQLHIALPVKEPDLREAIETQWPELWAKCYPRVYDDARLSDYCSVKATLAYHLAHTVVARTMPTTYETGSETSTTYEYIVANQLARFSVPTFFLSRSIAEALRQTKPPIALAWHDMELPFEAAAFMLPRGLVKHPINGDASFVAYARCKKGQTWDAPLLPGNVFGITNGGLVLLTAVTSPSYMFHYNWPYTHPISAVPVIHLSDLESAMHGPADKDDTSRFFFPEGMSLEDDRFVMEVAHYLFGALLIMLNRPDLVERGHLIKRVQKEGRPRREFWTPNIIGAHYRVARTRAVGAGDGTSPRAHWRRGHWRQQPYGPRATLRRDTWIEPVLVNAE